MNRAFLVAGLLVVGLILLGIGLLWHRAVPSKAYWSDAQAREYTTANAELHAIHGQSHEKNHDAKLEAARERFLTAFQQLEQARGARNRGATVLKIAGMSLLLLGIVLHLAGNRET